MFSEIKLRSCQKVNKSYELCFSLSWKGSWKNDINCDGVYIFAKYKAKGEDGYHSIKLSDSSHGEFDYQNKLPQKYQIKGSNVAVGGYVPYTRLGMFVYPMEKIQKTDIIINEISVISILEEEPEDIQLFALEMVYVPQDSHYIGDPGNGISKGGTLKNCFYTYPNKGAYHISSEEEIEFAPKEGALYCDLDTPNGREENDSFVIPAAFPKGYKAMWYMKYNLTEGQFVQFMNCLSRKQQQSHCMADISGDTIENYYAVTGTNEPKDRCDVICNRYGNGVEKPIKFYTSAPNRAMNAVAYFDIAALACFAGLRLATELEYEKACRGPMEAVKEEFAWGSSNIGRVFHFDGSDGSGTEVPIPQRPGMICNCNFGTDIAPFERDIKTIPDNPGWIGPVSVGLYENATRLEGYTQRECTGASYYGIMDLCGNVWESIISTGRAEGRGYIPEHGNGELDEKGYHTMSGWPDSKTAMGVGVRGGVFVSPNPGYIHMALRVFAAHTKNDKRYHGGCRVCF